MRAKYIETMKEMDELCIYSDGKAVSRIIVDGDRKRPWGRLNELLKPYPHVFVLADRNVVMKSRDVSELVDSLRSTGHHVKQIKAAETTKTMETVMEICAWLLESGADRDALVLAIGGGITTDMAGFAASIYKRGVRFAYVPTTLLAQVDAAIGGKTGVNFLRLKNMLGIIRQPEFTFMYVPLLASLPHRDFLSGACELLKTFIIEDGGYYQRAVDLLSCMAREYKGSSNASAGNVWEQCVLAHLSEIEELIGAAAAVKAGVVSRDAFEGGERRKLNLGHTFAHAIESLAQMENDRRMKKPLSKVDHGLSLEPEVTHGEAVAMGMVLAARLASGLEDFGMEPGLADRLETDFRACGLPVDSPFLMDVMAESMRNDKKAEGGKIHFILPRAVGDVVIHDLSVEEARLLLQ